jgi:hypothetical protein
MTIYGTFPILVPGTTESTSRNGLQKTSGTILFQPGQQDAALSLAEQNGEAFPDPQTRTTDIGLMEMTFDAYRDTGKGSQVRGSLLVKVSKTFSTIEEVTIEIGGVEVTGLKVGSFSVVESWVVDTITFFRVVSASAGSSQIPTPSATLTRSFKRRDIIGQVGPAVPGGADQSTTLNISWTQVLADVTRRNFGELDEVDVTLTLEPTVN